MSLFFLSQKSHLLVYKTQIPSCNQSPHRIFFFSQVVTSSFLLLALQLGMFLKPFLGFLWFNLTMFLDLIFNSYGFLF